MNKTHLWIWQVLGIGLIVLSIGFLFLNEKTNIIGMAFSVGTCPADKTILKVSATISNFTNQHAALYNDSSSGYSNVCSTVSSTDHICNAGDNVIVRLSGQTDAHAEQAGLATPSYSNVCFGNMKCNYTTTTNCSSAGQDYDCLISMSNTTNAHVANCGANAYGIKVCCTDGAKTGLGSCSVNCNDSDSCVCPSGCNAQGDISKGQNCGGIAGPDGIKSSLSGCSVNCTDVDGCSCPTNCNITGNVTQNQNCGGIFGSDENLTFLSDCQQSCTDVDGCVCPTNCTSDEIEEGESCGGEVEVEPPEQPETPLQLSDCYSTCSKEVGCICPVGCKLQGAVGVSQTCQGPKTDEFNQALDDLKNAYKETSEVLNKVYDQKLLTQEEYNKLLALLKEDPEGASEKLKSILEKRLQRLLSPKEPLDWLYVFIAAAVVSAMISGFVYGVKKVAHKEHVKIKLERQQMIQQAGLNPAMFHLKTQLEAYVRAALKAGQKKEDIVHALLQHKWPIQLIDATFQSIERKDKMGINTNVVQRLVQQRRAATQTVAQKPLQKSAGPGQKPAQTQTWVQEKEKEREKAVQAFEK